MPWPAINSAGPIWSKKTNGPTIRRYADGTTRCTSNLPKSRERLTMTVSRAAQAGAVLTSGSRAGLPTHTYPFLAPRVR